MKDEKENEKDVIQDVPAPETDAEPETKSEPETKPKAPRPKMLRAEKLALIRAIGFDTKSWYWKQASDKIINKTIKFFS